MTLIDDLRLRMPLRRNRRQYEQLTDFEPYNRLPGWYSRPPPRSGDMWYWARTRDKASHGPIPIPLGYRGHSVKRQEQLLSWPPHSKFPHQAKRNSCKIGWNYLKDLPMWPRRKAVAEFRLTTGHVCLLNRLHQIHVAQVPFCTLCDFRENMDADHIRRCPVLRGSCLCDLYW
ncbi:hypothetical protein TNCV_2504991 [Trichonephila clavipes]|uniref:Uncharacterized protein n=1 Tax=Trichonephila clavipes TaxID=2585209 RepID=A0A8X6WHW2_TRICX|nr:hypothetical protein TNCV_2504991 [Trichonephila clavipes]